GAKPLVAGDLDTRNAESPATQYTLRALSAIASAGAANVVSQLTRREERSKYRSVDVPPSAVSVQTSAAPSAARCVGAVGVATILSMGAAPRLNGSLQTEIVGALPLSAT